MVASRATSSDSCFNVFLINVIPDSACTASSKSTMPTGTLLCHWFLIPILHEKYFARGSSRHVYYHLIVGSYLSGVFFPELMAVNGASVSMASCSKSAGPVATRQNQIQSKIQSKQIHSNQAHGTRHWPKNGLGSVQSMEPWHSASFAIKQSDAEP